MVMRLHSLPRYACRPRGHLAIARSPPRVASGATRRYASVAAAAAESFPKPRERIHGFTLRQIKHVPELHLTALRLEHDKTGADYLHVARDDKNKVFAINFKTNPTDRTGLPHILEHVTLCGSHKYPVRDPFFKMMPRSLANFMNAFTAADYTSYPFATTNLQDFQNLSSVYLDATLHPLLKRLDFLQEGWRLGPEDPRESATEENVKFKGVVYNEMKGQMSDASYLFYIRCREHLFPALHNSGGDPEVMPDLTYDQLVAFSRQHYHPSNAKFFSYGNLSLPDHLQFVNDAISTFSKGRRDTDVKKCIDLSKGPLAFEVSGPVDTLQDPDRQVKSSVTWMGCPSADIVETFSVSMMMSLLMNGYGSPLYQGLIESGMGTNFSPNTGYDSSSGVGTLSLGLDGMRRHQAAGLRDTIQAILAEKGHEAFLPRKIEGSMHQLELSLKHKTSNFGMGLLEKALPGWFNGVDPIQGLAWNEVIGAFQDRLKEDEYLTKLMRRYFFNDQCMQFTMKPSPEYGPALEVREEERRKKMLQDIEQHATSPQGAISELGRQEHELLAEQENAQDKGLDSLPTLHVSDIGRQKERLPRSHAAIGNVDCLWRETSTNGITYVQIKHVVQDLPDDLRLLMPLFTDALMRLGTKTQSVGELESDILLKTGGINVSPFIVPDPWSSTKYCEGFLVDSYALDRNVSAMLDLIHTLLVEVDFASPNAVAAVLELLESKASGALDSVAESGHHFALSSAAAALSRRGWAQDQLSGLAQIEATARTLNAARQDPQTLQDVIRKLQQIQSLAISNSSSLSIRIVCEPDAVDSNRRQLERFLRRLPEKQARRESPPPSASGVGFGLPHRLVLDLPFQVSYTGTCLPTAPYSSPDIAPLTVLGQLLVHNILHPEIREKGGAYGASASASSVNGVFTMSSYRDPNPLNSLAVFRRAGTYARDKAWTARELEESKLSIFQSIDAPKSVNTESSKEFIYGITEDMDQKMREHLLDVSRDDVQRVAQEYLVGAAGSPRTSCVLGGKRDWIEKDAEEWQVRKLNISS